MSIQTSYNKGFMSGLEAMATKLAADFGVEKVALMDELKERLGITQPEPEPMFSGADMALGGGAAAAGGLSYGANQLGDSLGKYMATNADLGAKHLSHAQRAELLRASAADLLTRGGERGRELGQSYGALSDGGQKLQKRILAENPALAEQAGRGGRKARAQHVLDSLAAGRGGPTRPELFKDMQTASRNQAEHARTALGRQKAFQRKHKILDKLRTSGLDKDSFKGLGKGLRNLGVAGGLGFLGKKLYDVATD